MNPFARNARALCALATAAVFGLFLAASAPHRVHHLLEDLPAPTAAETPSAVADSPPPIKARGGARNSAQHSHDHGTSPAHHHHHSGGAAHHHHGHQPSPPAANAALQTEEATPLHANNSRRDGHHEGRERTDCAVQSAAQHAHLLIVNGSVLDLPPKRAGALAGPGGAAASHFNAAPFAQRAPPATRPA